MAKIPKKIKIVLDRKTKANNRVKRRKKPKVKKPTQTQKRGKVFSKRLALKATPSEKRFKVKLSNFNFNVNFQKTFVDGKLLYIADFYIPLFGLIIELDGGYHNDPLQIKYDKKRDLWFKKHGYSVWRLSNEDADAITTEELAIKFGTYKRLKSKPAKGIPILCSI